jgi:hypothetical protein
VLLGLPLAGELVVSLLELFPVSAPSPSFTTAGMVLAFIHAVAKLAHQLEEAAP